MAYIQAEKISFRYSGNTDYTLNHISFRLDRSSRVGIVGDNGTGKSTLLKLITGELIPEGHIDCSMTTGLLSQEIRETEKTVQEQIYSCNPQLFLLKQQIENFTGENAEIFSQYEELGGWQFETELHVWLDRYKLDDSFLHRKLGTLSGGEKTKTGIISLILRSPDILVLDEPTNHLDLESIVWLEEFLANSRRAFVAVSHDRTFLDRTVTSIWEIENGKLEHFAGNYSFYKQKKDEDYEMRKHLYEEQTKKIRQLTQAAKQRKGWALNHQAQTGTNGYAPVYENVRNLSKKSMRHAKVAEQRIERMIEKEEQKRPEYKEPARIEFRQQEGKTGRNCLTITNLCKCFSKPLFRNLNLIVGHGERIALTGRNGSGKTTLLKMIMGLESIDEGTIFKPEHAVISYYSQEYENLDYSKTILDELTGGDLRNQSNIRTSLGSMGFRGSDVFKPVSELSPGEKAKVSIVKVMLEENSLMLLDEPTNHLEIRTREVIEEALLRYKGSIIFVSHDRMFREKIAMRELNLDEL